MASGAGWLIEHSPPHTCRQPPSAPHPPHPPLSSISLSPSMSLPCLYLSPSLSLSLALSLSLSLSLFLCLDVWALPLHTLSCHLTTGFLLDSTSCPFHVSHDVLVMPLPILSTPLHAPVIFSVCPLHFPRMSRSFVASQFPTSPVAQIGCLVLCFPFIPLVSISVPFMSLSVPLCLPFIFRCFPVMSTSHFLPSFPCTSLHFPCAAQHFPQHTVFPAF